MRIRKTTAEDLDSVMELYAQARRFMREHGNPDQWGTAHPPRDMIVEDIRRGCSYVCEEDGELLGTFYLARETEPDYRVIYEGSWLDDEPYGVMHRVACPGRKKGTGTFCLNWCVEHSGGNLRIDTHRDNLPMQHMLEKNGFTRCGIIYMADGGERIAFQKHQKKI